MKNFIIILAVAFMTAGAYAQSPQKMSYQAIIRNSSDALVKNTQIGMQISILHGSVSGTVVYSETQNPNTNANGLVSIEIGGGTGFGDIDWANGTYFLKTETDPTGGTNYTITGTSQLLSVPYALYAEKSGNGFGGSYNDLTDKPDFSKWDIDSTNDILKPETAENGDLLTYDGNNWIAKRIVGATTGMTGGSQPFSTRDPYLALNYQIAVYGIFPSRNMGTDAYIASIGIFAGNFEVRNWAFCNGQLMSISQNTALFSLIGTYYGGDGRTTFGLPDLRGRVPVHFGQGPGLSNFVIGQKGGSETQTLLITNMPAHNHTFTITYE